MQETYPRWHHRVFFEDLLNCPVCYSCALHEYEIAGFLNLIVSSFVVDTDSVVADSNVRWGAYAVYILLLYQTARARTSAEILNCG